MSVSLPLYKYRMNKFEEIVLYSLLIFVLYYVQSDMAEILRHVSNTCFSTQQFNEKYREIMCLNDVGSVCANSTNHHKRLTMGFHGVRNVGWTLSTQWYMCIALMAYSGYRLLRLL